MVVGVVYGLVSLVVFRCRLLWCPMIIGDQAVGIRADSVVTVVKTLILAPSQRDPGIIKIMISALIYLVQLN